MINTKQFPFLQCKLFSKMSHGTFVGKLWHHMISIAAKIYQLRLIPVTVCFAVSPIVSIHLSSLYTNTELVLIRIPLNKLSSQPQVIGVD